MDLLASGASGNTNTSSTKANFLTLWQHGEHTEFLQLQYAYGKSDGEVDTDHAFAHLRHRTAISQDWGVEGFAQVGRDPFARLTRRTLYGGGMRWAMLEVEKISAVYLGFGAFHEYEILTDTLGTDDPREENLWRANTYLVLKHHLNDQVGIYSTTYYQPAFSDTADYRLLEQASVLVKLRDNLDFKISLDFAFDSMPPQTVEKRDLTYSTESKWAGNAAYPATWLPLFGDQVEWLVVPSDRMCNRFSQGHTLVAQIFFIVAMVVCDPLR